MPPGRQEGGSCGEEGEGEKKSVNKLSAFSLNSEREKSGRSGGKEARGGAEA